MDGVQWMIILILFHSRALSRVSCMSPVQLAVDHCRFLGERGRALPSRSLGFWRLTSL